MTAITAPAGDPPGGSVSTRVITRKAQGGGAHAGADHAPQARDRAALDLRGAVCRASV